MLPRSGRRLRSWRWRCAEPRRPCALRPPADREPWQGCGQGSWPRSSTPCRRIGTTSTTLPHSANRPHVARPSDPPSRSPWRRPPRLRQCRVVPGPGMNCYRAARARFLSQCASCRPKVPIMLKDSVRAKPAIGLRIVEDGGTGEHIEQVRTGVVCRCRDAEIFPRPAPVACLVPRENLGPALRAEQFLPSCAAVEFVARPTVLSSLVNLVVRMRGAAWHRSCGRAQ